nr:unnamed protein product [Callosobruchus chinensis]
MAFPPYVAPTGAEPSDLKMLQMENLEPRRFGDKPSNTEGLSRNVEMEVKVAMCAGVVSKPAASLWRIPCLAFDRRFER